MNDDWRDPEHAAREERLRAEAECLKSAPSYGQYDRGTADYLRRMGCTKPLTPDDIGALAEREARDRALFVGGAIVGLLAAGLAGHAIYTRREAITAAFVRIFADHGG